MTVFELKKEIQPYLNEHDMVSAIKLPLPYSKNLGDGNLLEKTGLYYCILHNAGAMTQVDKFIWDRILFKCKHDRFPIFWRSPDKKNPDDNQEHDDYHMIVGLDIAEFKGEYSKKLLDHLNKYNWSMDIQNPTKFNSKYYWERFFALNWMIRIGAGEASPLQVIGSHILALASVLWISDSDSRIRVYGRFTGLSERYSLIKIMFGWWKNKMRKKFGKVGKAFAGELPLDHPLTEIDW